VYLKILSDNLQRLGVLASWSDDEFLAFERGLASDVGNLANRGAVREAFDGSQSVSPQDAVDVFDAVMPLLVQYIADGKSAREVTDAVVAGVQRVTKRTQLTTDAELKTLKDRLLGILANHRLILKAKATDLVYERGFILSRARIISDLRPVFGTDTASKVEALTVIHTLVLTYLDDNGHKKLHLALDSADLRMMREVLKRAEAKQKALDSLVKTAQVSRIDVV
jgi:hypothetical protein